MRGYPALVNGSSPLRLGIDIGGTKCVAAVGRDDGAVLAQCRIEDWTHGEVEADLAEIVALARRTFQRASLEASEVTSIGVTAPGPLDVRTGVVFDAPNMRGWDGVALRAALEDSLGRPTRLENDANAQALAEWRHGAGQGARSLVYLTMSTGVGGGLILEGEIVRGAHGLAGELGHMAVVPGGRPCACGLRGCLEAYTGGRALAEELRREAAAGRAATLLERAGGDPARLDARLWARALQDGDATAWRIAEAFLDALAQGLATVVMGLDPERIVLGTLVRENASLLLPPLRERTRARVWKPLRDVEIVAGTLGRDLPARAALAVAALPHLDQETALAPEW
ncbi:MAG: ROK family protein [Myxococcota bacterium]